MLNLKMKTKNLNYNDCIKKKKKNDKSMHKKFYKKCLNLEDIQNLFAIKYDIHT